MSLSPSEEAAADAPRGDIALFAGANHARILRVYDAFAGGGGRLSFCWPGFLAPQAWFLYRKMYLWAALVSAGPLLVAYAPKIAVLNWGASLVGAMGLRLYVAGAVRTIARIRAVAADEAEAQALIVRAGGVSRVGAAFGLLFAFCAFVLSLKAGAHLGGR